MSMTLSCFLVPEAMEARFGPRRFVAMRRVLRALTLTPRHPVSIARDVGIDVNQLRSVLGRLIKAGLAHRLPGGLYARAAPTLPIPDEACFPMEVGRQILACLTEPRRAKDIAAIVNRPGSVTTGHLRSLLKRGLVVRLDWGVYALATRYAHVDSSAPVRLRKAPIDAPLLELLSERRSAADLSCALSRHRETIQEELRRLVKSGAVLRIRRGNSVTYVRADAIPGVPVTPPVALQLVPDASVAVAESVALHVMTRLFKFVVFRCTRYENVARPGLTFAAIGRLNQWRKLHAPMLVEIRLCRAIWRNNGRKPTIARRLKPCRQCLDRRSCSCQCERCTARNGVSN